MSFKRLDPEDFVVSADAVQSTLWSTGGPTLTTFYTSSTQAAGSSGNYYISVYQTASGDSSAAVQFDIAYADVKGSGSNYFNSNLPQYTPASTTFGQYQAMILEDENANFTFGDSTNLITGSDFWVLSVERARYKEKLFPGTFNLHLSSSGGLCKLTDNSNDISVQTYLGSTRVFQIVSGSNGSGITGGGLVAASGSYGLFLPDIGTILLNPYALSQSINLTDNRGADLTNGTNQTTLLNAIELGENFEMNSEETISSNYVFVDTKASEFNYSENPTFISGSTGEIIYDLFINNPEVYITTVGLYNDSNDLLAVAKLSRPLLNNFKTAAKVRIKLDF